MVRAMRTLLLSAVMGAAVQLGCVSAAHSDSQPPFKAEIDQFSKADSESRPPSCAVLFVGSSSIVRWKTLVQDMAPLPVINRGFGGAQIEDINRWFDRIVEPYRPRSIVFYAGENDIAAGKPVARVLADFQAFMTRKTETVGKVPVYFISLKPSRLRFEQLALQSQVNETISELAERRDDLHFIDVATSMLQEGKPKDLFTDDDVHMVTRGYALWTEAVRAALLPNAEAEVRNCNQFQRSIGR
jgi:lysophospholipase L1-like esterase